MRKFGAKFMAIVLSVSMMMGVVGDVSAKDVVKLNKSSITLNVGQTKQLKVTSTKVSKVTWVSSKAKVAKVSSSGKVKAVKAGSAEITAKVKLKNKQIKRLKCKVKVKAKSTANVAETAAPSATPTPMSTWKDSSGTMTFYEPETCSTYAPSLQGEGENNPILTNSFACDPYAMEYNGRLYVYMTNDSQQFETGNRAESNSYEYIQSLHIISTDDMVNWTDHGTYQIAGDNGVCTWAGCCWAPCAVHKTVDGKEKFYIYFTNGGYQIGVVASDSPTGPFTDIKGSALLGPDNAGGTQALDPAAFIDDDGSAYLTYGATDGGRIYKLGDDMMSFEGDSVDLNVPYMFEDSGLNKINGKYYYSYCSDWNTRSDEYSSLGLCSIGYMVSDNIMGPYTFVGDVLPNCGTVFDDVWGNNHHSLVEFKGEYYMFYHTRVLETKMNCGLGYRSTQVNKAFIQADGTITQVAQDLKGVDQIADFDPYTETSGTEYADCGGMISIHDGVDGAYMESIYNPDKYDYSWSSVSGAAFGESTACTFDATLEGEANSTITMKVCLDSKDGSEIVNTKVSFDSNGKATVSMPVSTISGTHDVYFEFNGKVKNFVSWKFTK